MGGTFSFPQISLPEMLRDSAERFSGRPAISFYHVTLTYEQVWWMVQRAAVGLAAAGVRKGDRVAIMLPNCPHYVIAYYAVLAAGGIVVQVNPMYTGAELEHLLADADPKVIVAYEPLWGKVEAVWEKTHLERAYLVQFPGPVQTPATERVQPVEALLGAQGDPPSVAISPEDTAVLQYTGGTTGYSKGAMLTHRNLVANVYQSLADFRDGLRDGEEVILLVLPLFHVYGMTVGMNLGIAVGANLVMLPRFQLDEVLDAIKTAKPTMFPGVPTMYVAVNSHPKAREYGIDSIRICNSGSAPLPVEVLRAFEEKTGGKILEGYGLTEASPVTHTNPYHGVRKVGSIGLPVAGTEARIVDIATGLQELPPGEPGELVVRGPQVMKGYWNRPEETAQVLRDGWLHTGDIATRDDDGYYYIVDRKKDMIIASGFNVYPREVEEVLYTHPGIQEAAVVGVPDPYRGETVKAYVVCKPGVTLTRDEVIAFCRERMAHYKAPTEVEFREELPKSSVGKILRRALRDSQP
ncbi:long-chain fatty acid--CoA ligase [Kyrpidia spormannii]|uniref:Long-chain-fatty-acid--CoA ligase n=1 Tax=Kyrpidia spormannii TaxID=2055160 RepID=A0A2K8N874_9BACL|nr:long-chain fatty acid--CoA ligase [Kyrpidia spormannii]ATY85549.1 long-chain fatty acid--CoA ligase [Kyrpidia spormannii]